MSETKYGFVYIWYDRKHKRYYIGCHWGRVDDGYVCSSNWMRDAYRRRSSDFRRRIIKTNLTRTEMYQVEQNYLDMIDKQHISPNTKSPRYYNLHLSSKNLWHKHEHRAKTIGQKISEAKRGKKTGSPSDETRAKISAAKRGMQFSADHREKLRQAKLGKKLSAEHREKVIKSLTSYKYDGRT